MTDEEWAQAYTKIEARYEGKPFPPPEVIREYALLLRGGRMRRLRREAEARRETT